MKPRKNDVCRGEERRCDTVGTYRPLEVEGHPDVRDVGGFGVGAKDVGERGAVRARRLRADVLRVFETHAEKYLTVARRRATDAAGAGEGVDLQLEDSGGQRLGGGTGTEDTLPTREDKSLTAART